MQKTHLLSRCPLIYFHISVCYHTQRMGFHNFQKKAFRSDSEDAIIQNGCGVGIAAEDVDVLTPWPAL